MLTLYLMNLHQISSHSLSLSYPVFFLSFLKQFFFLMNEKVKREEMEAAKKESLHASMHYMCQEWAKQWIYFQKRTSLSLCYKWQDNIFNVEVISLEWQTVQERITSGSCDCIFNPQTIHNLLSIILEGWNSLEN